MKKITIKKLHFKEIQVLQYELELYVTYISDYCIQTDFLNAIISMDIASHLYFILRTKLEQDRIKYSIGFTVSQAATIMKCCNYDRTYRSDYSKNVLRKYSSDIDQQLKSLI